MAPQARKSTQAPVAPGETSNVIGAADSDPRESGWKVGNRAPGSKYAPMGADGQADLSKVSSKPVEGYGVQVVAEGDTISQAVYDQLNQ